LASMYLNLQMGKDILVQNPMHMESQMCDQTRVIAIELSAQAACLCAHAALGSENPDRGPVSAAIQSIREAKPSVHAASLSAHAARLRK
jgi:hypothetical protein